VPFVSIFYLIVVPLDKDVFTDDMKKNKTELVLYMAMRESQESAYFNVFLWPDSPCSK